MNLYMGYLLCQLPETVGIDTDNAYGNNVPNADNYRSDSGNTMSVYAV